MIKTILITNQADIAADCEAAGVTRIMVDLETLGKKERQASRTTFISSHHKNDIRLVRAALGKSELIVRINPWHEGSRAEIEHAVIEGADFIMLPMITDVRQVYACNQMVAGRVKLLPLIETVHSMEYIDAVAVQSDVSEVYIGLNDLHLALGHEFLFEPLAGGLLDVMATKLHSAGKPFGFGGIARMGSGELPARHILAEHQRLGSSRVILSSRFCKDIEIDNKEGRKARIQSALAEMHHEWERLEKRSPAEQQKDFLETSAIIRRIAGELKQKRRQA